MAQLAFVLALVLVAAGFSLPRGALAISASAQQVVVIDVESTDILFQKNSTQPMTPSSMTKVMTAYLVFNALERGEISLSTEFEVSQKAASRGGSTCCCPRGGGSRSTTCCAG